MAGKNYFKFGILIIFLFLVGVVSGVTYIHSSYIKVDTIGSDTSNLVSVNSSLNVY
jgi:hypothetical protein